MRTVGKPAAACPCGSGQPYPACCGRFHAGQAAPTAEALMRSRYSAYVHEDRDYLLATWAAETRPAQLDFDEEGSRKPTWLGLKVHRHEQHGDTAEVEFTARFRIGGGSAQRMHERSRFRREGGRWYYVDGEVG